MYKNGTITATYSVKSTKETPFGKILTYQGYPSLGFWPPSSHCDSLADSLDFFTFPKRITKDTVFNIFLPENCRSLQLRYVQEDVFRGIPVFVFKFPLEQFSNNLQNDETACYCLNYHNTSDPTCLDAGLMDYAGCSKGAPLLGSFPHFLHANPRHLKNLRGISPNKSLHESEIMIEPITGTPLYAVRRFQLNLRTRPIPLVTYFENMTERIVPLAWFEHILEVPSTTFTAVKQKLEELKLEADAKDIYQHDENPIEEMDDNTLFASRSGFPGSSGLIEEESPSNEIRNASTAPSIGSHLHSSYFAIVTTALVLLLSRGGSGFISETSLNLNERV
ncbi:Platelet glycoprotein 4 [Orchesella cincta]|uniref:Platelet glycoprotein 4 n=1 Tax=Orchesella cincta TaxID=48709 RepID=A0A1D2MF59_ORCCI|nr:Platelet glycoprotein 4 [Orchesella cincta]